MSNHIQQQATFTAPPETLLLAIAVGGSVILAQALLIIGRETRKAARWAHARRVPRHRVRVSLEALPQFLAAPPATPDAPHSSPPWSPEPRPEHVAETMVEPGGRDD